ncbi:MAG: helix-turn-helix transcriptional regulator [Acidimicrobiaceae bacterium]|nr:helix-turn-helix transcriptional regulator [Acidimicrobiaceae bacterium]
MLISTVVDVSGILADPLRFRIVDLLANEELCTCHLVELTGAKQPTISHHLKVLRDAGIVSSEPVGRNTYYRLRAEALQSYALMVSEIADRAAGATRDRLPCL